MTLLSTELLIVLVVVPLLALAYRRAMRRRRPVAARYSSLSLIAAAGPPRRRWRRHVPIALLLVSVSALAFALARPVAVLSVPSNQTTIVLAIDVSGSMCATDIDPTRLRAAKDAAQAFIAAQPEGTEIGLVAFSSFSAVIQSPTGDRAELLDAVESLTVGRGTAIGLGILTAIDAIAEIDPNVAPAEIEGRPGLPAVPVLPGAYSPAIIVALTDGANNAGIEPVDAAQQAADRGLRVFTIGFGTEEGAGILVECRRELIGNEPRRDLGGGGGFGFGGGGRFRRGIDEETLQAVADLTGGSYAPAESADELQQVFSDLPTTTITRAETVELSVVFVALGAALAAASLLLGRQWRPLP